MKRKFHEISDVVYHTIDDEGRHIFTFNKHTAENYRGENGAIEYLTAPDFFRDEAELMADDACEHSISPCANCSN
jgi:hypothetical protein